jgi:hypothetical protein
MEPYGARWLQTLAIVDKSTNRRSCTARAAERLGPIESTIAIMHGVAEAGMVHLRLTAGLFISLDGVVEAPEIILTLRGHSGSDTRARACSSFRCV